MVSKVKVLGAGPAGLLAAHAAVQAGRQVSIHTEMGRPSFVGGAQFIHNEIEGIDVAADFVELIKVGKREDYAAKVYGNSQAPCSWDSYPEGRRLIWSMRKIYELLWDKYSDLIVWEVFDHDSFSKIIQDHDTLVVNSIPLKALCPNPSEFQFQSAEITVATRRKVSPGAQNVIVWHGEPESEIYRSSMLFGHFSVEYSGTPTFETNDHLIRVLSKPTFTNYKLPPQVLCVGRFGRWDKNELADAAYFRTLEAM